MRRWLCPFLFSVGCISAAPPPRVEVPARYAVPSSSAPTNTLPRATATVADLWARFGSSELRRLLDSARMTSLENAASAARVAQQDAALRVARAPLFPSLALEVDLSAQSSNSKSMGSIRGGFLDPGLVAAYEIDTWGKNRLHAQSARALRDASRYERAHVELTVSAGVAETYFEILSLRERIARGRANLEAAQRVLAVVEARERAGSALAREVAQQRSLVASEAVAVEQIAVAESDARVQLAVVSGRPESEVVVQAEGFDEVQDPALVSADIDVPQRLLTQRPDIARAESELAASHADAQSARTALLPQIRLAASAALQTVFLSEFASGSSWVYNGQLSFTQPIFDGGALRGNRDVAAARKAEAEAEYRRAVVNAVNEVEKALRELDGLQKQHENQRIVVDEARRAMGLIQVEYEAGSEDLLAVLDAQRTLFRAQDDFSQLRLAKLRAAVSLVKALGGGWSKEKRSTHE